MPLANTNDCTAAAITGLAVWVLKIDAVGGANKSRGGVETALRGQNGSVAAWFAKVERTGQR